jgi:tetratricopeptide (TPR) repeat protein
VDAQVEQLVSRLQADPNDADAYEALKKSYRESGDMASLTNLIEGWAAYQADAVKASRGYFEAAEVVAAVSPQHARRGALLRQAAERDVTFREATTALLQWLSQQGDDHALAEFLDRHLRAMEEKHAPRDLMAHLYVRLGDLWGSQFTRPDVARRCYERALELDGNQSEVLAGARRLAEATQDKALFALILGAEAAAEAQTERKVELYSQQADLYLTEPADFTRAAHALRAAHQLAPHDVPLMDRLAHVLSDRGAQTTGDEGVRDVRRAAELHYQIAQELPTVEALPHLETALAAVPEHEGALHALEVAAEELGQQALLPKYWLGFIANAQESPELDRRRVLLAQAYERAGQIDDAIACLERVRNDSTAASLLTELKVRRGPRASRPPGAPETNGGERPSSRPLRARKTSDRPLDVEPALRELRRALRNAIAARKTDEAVQRCTEIFELDPSDTEAFSLLETHYRKTSDHVRLRELLLASSEASGVAIEERKQRLREVAALSESKLKDIEGAIEVWRNVVALDPNDVDAAISLKRLLQRTERWDEYVLVLEREALAAQDPEEKSALLSQIAAVHRDKRNDPSEAAEALRQLLSLRPSATTRDELCELLLAMEGYAEAAPLLRQRAQEADGERERLRVFRQLAEILESKLLEPEASFDICQRILDLRPKDADTLERMQRIDERTGNANRLLSTLERRAALLLRSERVSLLVHMAKIAEEKLDYYRKALEIEPGREGLLDALCQLFETRARYAELFELLAQAASAERDPSRRVELLLRRARLASGPLDRPIDAADAYREVLTQKEDPEALGYLLDVAREASDPETTALLCARLAAVLDDAVQCRALLYERAQVLTTELGRPRDAITTLRNIVENVDPDYEPAIEWLAELSGNLGDHAGLASALSRRLDKSGTQVARVALAKRLAQLYEQELGDREQAVSALLAWAKADPNDVTPQRKLRRLLEETGRFAELVTTCDALATLEEDPAARDRAILDAAHIAFTQLRNPDAAWRRLLPLVSGAHPNAIQLLCAVARASNRSDELASLCVRAAQEATAPELQGALWAHAARIYRDELGNPAQALEAALRLLATDLKSRDALTQVEESAVQAGQWARLVPVYDRLIKAAANDMERVELLVRHADLLERRANSPSDALDRVLQASALAPTDEALIARAEQLAARGDRGAELVAMCERQAAQTTDPRVQVEWLVRAARFSISTADDKPAAQAYLEAALAASGASVALWESCISAAQQLDPEEGASEPQLMLKALIAAHRKVAQRSAPAVGATLMLRASRLLEERLADERAAFDMLRNGSAMFPLDENLYETLLERAEANGRLDALDAHLSRGVDDALDAVTAAGLLARRARLLEGPLGRPDDAANVYAKLLQLSPDDLQAAAKLRDSLRRAKRFQDLLVVIHKQMQRAKRSDEKLELLKESAHIWELDLKNRWEAVDAWRKVLEHSPRDAEAIRALTRLDRRSLPPIPPPSAADEHEPEAEKSNGAEHASVEEPAAPQPTAARVEEVKSVDVVPIDETQPVATEELQLQAQPTTARTRRTTTQPPPPPPDALRHSTRPPQSGGPPPPPPKSNPTTKA